MKGLFYALIYKNGITDNISSEKKALLQLRDKWEPLFNNYAKDYKTTYKDIDKIKDEFVEYRQEQRGEFEDTLRAIKKSLKRLSKFMIKSYL